MALAKAVSRSCREVPQAQFGHALDVGGVDIGHAVYRLEGVHGLFGGIVEHGAVIAAQLDLQGAAAVLRSPTARDAGDIRLCLGDAHIGRLDVGGERAHIVGDLPDGATALTAVHELDLDAAFIGQLALDALGDAVRLSWRRADGRLDVDGEARLIRLRHVLHADEAERHQGDDSSKDGQDGKEQLFRMAQAPIEHLDVEALGPP